MGKNNIANRNVSPIGVSNIDVYNTNKRKYENFAPKYAEKVRIRIGVFFDGTGNNSFNSDTVYYKQSKPIDTTDFPKLKHKGFEVLSDSSYWNRYSNVRLLHDLYETKDIPPLNELDAHRYLQLKVYVQGIGTLRDAEDDTLGMGFGEGDRGVIGRVEQACNDIAGLIEDTFTLSRQRKAFFIESIEFDIFGFSRGAAAARHFANEVLKQKNVSKNIRIKEESLPIKSDKRIREIYLVENDNVKAKTNDLIVLSEKEFTGGKLGELLAAKKIKYPIKHATVEFLGLFDTVIAQFLEKKGAIDFARKYPIIPLPVPLAPPLVFIAPVPTKKVAQIKKVNPDVSHSHIKKVFQIVASNEWRENFAITPINNYSYGSSMGVLGAHSDVGGCYADVEFEINLLHFFDLALNANDAEVVKAEYFMSDLRQWYISNLFCVEEEINWETMHHVKILDSMGTLPGTDMPVYNDFIFKRALINGDILGTDTEKIIDGKKYQLDGYHYVLKSKRKLNNKLSLVYMNAMKHMAIKFANVPFTLDPSVTPHPEEYRFDENYKLDENPNTPESYQDLIIKVAEHGWLGKDGKPIQHNELFNKENGKPTYKIPMNLYHDVKRYFVHLSANFNSTIPYLEYFYEYQFVYPNVPNFNFEDDYKNPPYIRESYTPVLAPGDKK